MSAPSSPQDQPCADPAQGVAEASVPGASSWADVHRRMAQWQAAGAMVHDPVGWHYLQTLAERARLQSPGVQDRLRDKLLQRLQAWPGPTAAASPPAQARSSSPLAALLEDMAPTPAEDASHKGIADPAIRLGESPRIRQLRAQLRQWAVQQQFSQALALAPQNAGPINSHRLVLRALERMYEISPDYLQRFMVHLDTLMALQERQSPSSGHSRPVRARPSPRT